MKRIVITIVFSALCALALIACSNSNAAGAGSASQTVQDYLQARVEGNLDKMINLSCADWEAQARVEATSFKSMKASLDGVTCKDTGTSGDYTLVSCTGKIVTSYNGESREWSVSDHPYRVAKDGGDWRMCGYQK